MIKNTIIISILMSIVICTLLNMKKKNKMNKIKKQIFKNNEINIVKDFLSKVQDDLYSNYNYDKTTKSVKFKRKIEQIIFIVVFEIIMIMLLFGINFFSIIMTIFIGYISIKTIIIKTRNEESVTITKQIPDFLLEIKNFYYENKMILNSLEEALKNVPYEISLKGKEIYEILTSKNVKLNLEKFNLIEENMHLKLLANILYITMEYGDVKKDNNSLFIVNLNYLLEDVNFKINEFEKLKMKLTGLIFTSLFPLMFIKFIEIWSVSNFETLNVFYTSMLGFLIKVLIVSVTVIITCLLTNMGYKNNLYVNKEKYNFKYEKIGDKTFNSKLDSIVKYIKPNKNEKTYVQILNLLREAKIDKTVNDIYKNKVLYFVVGILISLVTFIKDNTYLNKTSNITLLIEIIIIFSIGIICYHIPNFIMQFKKKSVNEFLDKEIDNFNIIILMLINYERTTVEFILEYMEKFSVICNDRIQKCILNFQKDKITALNELSDSISNKNFKRIIRNLILASRNISIKEAFEFLETDRSFIRENKIIASENEIIKKVNLAQTLSFIPYYTIIILYFVFPIIKEGIKSVSEIILQIKNI